jgi:prevent-host-death family protein
MGFMSVRELNANVSKALAAAEAGEDVVVTRNGKPVLRITKEGVDRSEQERLEAVERLIKLMERGIPGLHGPVSYEDRTER